MNGFHHATRAAAVVLMLAVSGVMGTARADDVPSLCTSLKRIVAARPAAFSTLTPGDSAGIAQPNGRDPHCELSNGAYRCEWTPREGASASDALEGVAADIAACLPDATHDQNSPARQHFFLGERGDRTQIAATVADGGRIRLVVSGR